MSLKEAVSITSTRGSNKVNSDDPTTIIRVVLEGAHAEPTEARPAPL